MARTDTATAKGGTSARSLVDRKILTDEQVNYIFTQGALNQRASVKPANQEATDLLDWMVSSRSLKWR